MESPNQSPLPAVGVSGVVFNSEGDVLLIRRGKSPAFGQWSVPGGKLEPGESLAEACRREIKEETGLDVELKAIIAVVERRIENFHYVIIDFLAIPASDCSRQPVPQSDAIEARWVKLDELQQLELVAGLAEIIGRAYRYSHEDTQAGLYDTQGEGTDFIAM